MAARGREEGGLQAVWRQVGMTYVFDWRSGRGCQQRTGGSREGMVLTVWWCWVEESW